MPSSLFRTERRHSRRRVLFRDPRAEILEARVVLSADVVASPAITASPLAFTASPSGLSPAQIRQAYGLSNITFSNGAIAGRPQST